MWCGAWGSSASGFTPQAGQGVVASLGVGHDDGGGDTLAPVRLELGRRPALILGAVRGPLGQGMECTRGAAVEAAKRVVDAQELAAVCCMQPSAEQLRAEAAAVEQQAQLQGTNAKTSTVVGTMRRRWATFFWSSMERRTSPPGFRRAVSSNS